MDFDRDVRSLALKLLAHLDSPMALRVAMHVKAGEWDVLTKLSVDPTLYLDSPFGAAAYFKDAQAIALLKKFPCLPTTFDKSEVAKETFWACEKQCTETNVRLARFDEYPVLETKLDQAADALLRKARGWIARTLGQLPDFLDGKFGPGTTYEAKEWSRRNIVAYDKLCNTPSMTAPLRCLEDHLVWQTSLAGAWGVVAVNRFIPTARGNRFTTVPKDSSKDRGICIEPGLNIWAQLSVGSAIRQRLRNVGIDLNRNQQLHRELARAASLSGRSSTIDLSNASDTVSYRLVKLLLPSDWFAVLDLMRSPLTEMKIGKGRKQKKRWVHLQKFSSMGNGYTFELETLIFAALCYAVGGKVGKDTHVYGDDIIVPSGITRDVLAILRFCGFTPNERKTFVSSAFRESCGGDFFSGFNVRPYYLKELPHDPATWMAVANGLWSVSSRGLANDRFTAARRFAMDQLPTDLRRSRGPRSLGDSILHDHPARWTYKTKWSKRWFRCWSPVSTLVKLERFGREVAMTAATLGLPSGGLSPRDSVVGHRRRWLTFS